MAHAVVQCVGLAGVLLADQLEIAIDEEAIALDYSVGEIGGAVVHDDDLEEVARILGV